MLNKKSRVRYLAENIDDIPKDPDRGRMLLTLLYWKVFDGIDIPDTLMREIMSKGTNPETLGRLARFVNNERDKETIRNEDEE